MLSLPPSSAGPTDAALGIHLDPANAPLDVYFMTSATSGRDPMGDSPPGLAPSSFVLRQRTARLSCPADGSSSSPAASYSFSWDIVPHRSDPRDALRWEVSPGSPNAAYWRPHGGREAAQRASGLGTYSSYFAVPNATVAEDQGVRVGWDLSGRFFPYMGMFLPPVESDEEQWHNDPEGTQAPANVSRR